VPGYQSGGGYQCDRISRAIETEGKKEVGSRVLGQSGKSKGTRDTDPIGGKSQQMGSPGNDTHGEGSGASPSPAPGAPKENVQKIEDSPGTTSGGGGERATPEQLSPKMVKKSGGPSRRPSISLGRSHPDLLKKEPTRKGIRRAQR